MLSRGGFRIPFAPRRRRRIAAVLAVALLPALISLSVAQSASAVARHVPLPDPKPLQRVVLSRGGPVKRAKPRPTYARFDPSGHAALPAAQETLVTVPASPGRAVRAGSSPVSVGRGTTGSTPSRVRVTTVDPAIARSAGVTGVLFALSSVQGAGAVTVTVDDSTFRNAYGGGYASRLRLVRLPACALTTPAVASCQAQTPVLDRSGGSLSTRVTLASSGATVLAATAGASGSAGDYGATSLSPAGTWATSGNTGAFTYSYPITVPKTVSAVAPDVDLGYHSAQQDARTLDTNNQSSWVGDGWSDSDNYVERTYESCSDVKSSGAPDNSGDLCWAGQVLTLSLNGTSTQIVYDAAKNTLRPANDSATTKIEMLSGPTSGTTNGTDNREYFRVTEGGVQYYFGLNRLPGWSSGATETRSVWTVPVYRAHDGVSTCSGSATFADTACTLGYRFNLDYVVDPSGNAMAYYYAPETGYYGADGKNTAVAYTRGGTLARIDYGLTSSTVYSGTALDQIVFTTGERCIPGQPAGNTCSDGQFSEANAAFWPDVPIDLSCDAGTSCTHHAPTFWSRKRLSSIVTQVQTGGATRQIDRYDLTPGFPDNGDHAPTLWLGSITHTGLDTLGGASGSTVSGTTTFNPLQLANRVGTIAGLPRMYYQRIGTVISETGAETDVVYDTPDCSSVPSSDTTDAGDSKAQAFASTNTTGCFPVYWTPEAQPQPLIDWFYTHPVTSVTTYDNNNHYQDGSSPRLLTQYTYVGTPGWHYDDNEVVKAKNRTWGQFRGYPEVDVTTGDTSAFHYSNQNPVHDQRTLTRNYYFRGMNGDTLPGGKTRSVPNLTSTDGSVTVPDRNEFAGQIFETVNYSGDGGSVQHATVNVPTTIGPTASRTRDGLPALQAVMVRTTRTLGREKVSYGWRNTETDTFYNTTLGQNTTGMPVQTDDRGEPGATGNATRCTFTRYLDGGADTVVAAAETVVTDQDCASAGASPSGTLISDTRISYDGHAFAYDGDGQANPALPTKAQPTLVQDASAATGATATAFVDTTATTYDSYGRATAVTRTPKSTAADGKTSIARTTYTRYSPAAGALPTSVTTVTQVTPGFDCSAVTTSSKDCQLGTNTRDPARELSLTSVDVSGALTSLGYDALGRLTAVWQPNQSRTAGAPANLIYTYALSATGPSVVTTRTLEDPGDPNATTPAYRVGKVLYDAMMRPLESQATGENGSTVVSDTQYDSHGWTVLTNNSYAVAGDPADSLISDHLSQVSVPATTVTDYDAMGRPGQVTSEHNGVATWYTRTAYTGDSTTVLPPTGGAASTRTTNARGQITELQLYSTRPTVGGNAAGGFTTSGGTSANTNYTYTAGGSQSTVTGPDGSVWKFFYDQLGRQTSMTDPDTGTGFSKYDDAGDTIATKDARGIELDFTYDLLGRKLTATDKTKNFEYASWAYDSLRIGRPTSSTRYVSGVTGGYTVAITGYTALGNPLGQTVTLPSVERPLPASYSTSYAYTPNNEQLAQQVDPAVGGLPGETITYGHDPIGAPTKTSGIDLYASGAIYTDFGQLSKLTMGDSTNEAEALYSYDEYTLRLTGRSVYRDQAPGPLVDDIGYTYDDAGNQLSVTDKQSETGSTVTDLQCFRYDGRARLTDAWTGSGACADQPAAAAVSNSAGSYWQSYSYDSIGDRTQLVDHSTTGGTDVTTGYTNGCSSGCNRSGAQPHSLTATTGGTDPTQLVYDVDGNLLTRTATSGAGQTLSWDDEGHLASVTSTGGSSAVTKYLYDADGNQLIRRDPGRTTLFAGDTQVVINTSVSPAVSLGAVRTYSLGGVAYAIAVRSTLPGGGADYLFNDPHGTATLAMDTTTQKLSRLQYKPYGETRGSPNSTTWPDATHGYLGAATDVGTGYTDLGARKYDPSLGRFISADPALETTDPNELGGYTYAGDNPVTEADPTGLCNPDICAPQLDHTGSSGSSGGGGGGDDEPTDGESSGGDEWYKVWKPRHDTAVRMTVAWLQQNRPGVDIDAEVAIAKGSLNNNTGWADIVAWGPNEVEVWEVKHGGGAAELAGPAQLQKYITALRTRLSSSGDPRRVVTGGQIPELGPEPNPANPQELITAKSGAAPGIVTYQYTKDEPRIRVPVPVPQPRAVTEEERGKRPDWVRTRPLWQPQVADPAPMAHAPMSGGDSSGGGLSWPDVHVSVPQVDQSSARAATAGGTAVIVVIAILLIPVGA
ncbi:RHS repeat domain-containing protein [Actinoplanes subtropicus]|uniref:RHS repeat domain-containing protein n=1 Tax=Actinoplanes subtropicus TaxID=543632 RepID=UPI00068B4587|nr:RHS repeat-associated core domain-containing protein [Actinoplanes subtropicus]